MLEIAGERNLNKHVGNIGEQNFLIIIGSCQTLVLGEQSKWGIIYYL